MTNHPVYKNVFISILELGFCREREAWEMEVPSKFLKAVHSFGKVRSGVGPLTCGEKMVVEMMEN